MNEILDKAGLTAYDTKIKQYIKSMAGGGGSVPVVSVEGTTVTQQLDPNKFYSFGEVSTLTVSFGTPIADTINEYAFEFYSGATATVLTLPNNILWEEPFFIIANRHYIVCINYSNEAEVYYGKVEVIDKIDYSDAVVIEAFTPNSGYNTKLLWGWGGTTASFSKNIKYVFVNGVKFDPLQVLSVYQNPGLTSTIAYFLYDPSSIQSNCHFGGDYTVSIYVPDSVKYIGSSSIHANEALHTLTGFKNVEYISRDFLLSITNSTWYTNQPDGLIYLGNVLAKIKNGSGDIVIKDGIKSIGSYVVPTANNAITSVTIPNTCSYIDVYAFTYCGIASINIPDSVLYIGSLAFDNASTTLAVIGNGITYIGAYAFKNVTQVTITAENPPSISSNTFSSGKITNIYVPAASVDAYKAATNWSTFASKISAIQ